MTKFFSAEERVAIDDYLWEKLKMWGGILGLTNILALLGSLIYIFFILPNSAAHQASVHVNEELRNSIEDARKAVMSVIVSSAVESDHVEQLKEQNLNLEKTIIGLKKTLTEINHKSDEAKLLLHKITEDKDNKTLIAANDLVKTLNTSSGEVKRLIDKIDEISADVGRQRKEIYGDLSKLVTGHDIPKDQTPEWYNSSVRKQFQEASRAARELGYFVAIPTGEQSKTGFGFFYLFPRDLINSFEEKAK